MSGETKVFEGKHVQVFERGDWEYVERRRATEAVAVVALTAAGELVLTEQFRQAVNARVIDVPAGLVGDEEGHDDPALTAQKELEEETGFHCTGVRFLARGPSSPGITSEIVSFYRAENPERREEGGGVGGEDIAVHVVPLGGIRKWLADRERTGVLVDLKVWSAVYWAS
jgi:ADP-ribose pyrophosphatase